MRCRVNLVSPDSELLKKKCRIDSEIYSYVVIDLTGTCKFIVMHIYRYEINKIKDFETSPAGEYWVLSIDW